MCALSPYQDLKWGLAMIFFADKEKFLTNLRKIRPTEFDMGYEFPVVNSDEPNFSGQQICQAMTRAGI
jgi:hypothetical protein